MTVDLLGGDIELTGRIMPASNATFLGLIDDVEVVYKPVAGERPLWDFPDGTLAGREVAAHTLSEALGWAVVPPTWLRDGPHGPGMVQRWQHVDDELEAVTLVGVDEVPDEGWCHVLDGIDADERPVALIHEDSAALRRMAVFDVLANNADRKGGHVLTMSDGRRLGVDHGLTFHAEHKLRTVLWGWVDDALHDDELAAVRSVRADLDGALSDRFEGLVTAAEVDALVRRCDRLLERGTFPAPSGDMPAVPWPPF